MYAYLYESMILWYQRWYKKDWQVHTMTVMGLGMCTFYQLVTIANILWIAGIREGSYLSNGHRVAYLNGVLLLAIAGNAVYSRWKASPSHRRTGRLHRSPKLIVPIYFVSSFVGFLGTLFWALATTGRG
jgi:uncharacterized membrane protein YfcA